MAKIQAFLMAVANEKSLKQQHKKMENAESCACVCVCVSLPSISTYEKL